MNIKSCIRIHRVKNVHTKSYQKAGLGRSSITADVMNETLTLQFCKTTELPLLLYLSHTAVAENIGEKHLSLSSRLLDCQYKRRRLLTMSGYSAHLTLETSQKVDKLFFNTDGRNSATYFCIKRWYFSAWPLSSCTSFSIIIFATLLACWSYWRLKK